MSDKKHVVTVTRMSPEQLQQVEAQEREEAKSARERARFAGETFDHGRGDVSLAMSRLTQAFPALTDAAGVEPFDPIELAEWAKAGRSHGEICSVQFILSVWNYAEAREEAYGLPYFDLQEAYGVWDRFNRQAFVGWAEEPWWP